MSPWIPRKQAPAHPTGADSRRRAAIRSKGLRVDPGSARDRSLDDIGSRGRVGQSAAIEESALDASCRTRRTNETPPAINRGCSVLMIPSERGRGDDRARARPRRRASRQLPSLPSGCPGPDAADLLDRDASDVPGRCVQYLSPAVLGISGRCQRVCFRPCLSLLSGRCRRADWYRCLN
jgi:hypothetical protein